MHELPFAEFHRTLLSLLRSIPDRDIADVALSDEARTLLEAFRVDDVNVWEPHRFIGCNWEANFRDRGMVTYAGKAPNLNDHVAMELWEPAIRSVMWLATGIENPRHFATLRREAADALGRYLNSLGIDIPAARSRSYDPQQAGEDEDSANTLYVLDDGYRTARWRGETFEFTPKQAAVVRALARARAALPDGELLLEANSDGSSLRDLFRRTGKKHPAWGTLIVSPSKGRRRLAAEKIVKPEFVPS